MNPGNGAGGGGGVYWAWACSKAASTSAPAERVFRVGFMMLVFGSVIWVGSSVVQCGFAAFIFVLRRRSFFQRQRFNFWRGGFAVRADFEKFNELLAQFVIIGM